MSAAFTYEHEETGVYFVWHGGEYIDVHPYKGGDALEVINVWDHANDTPRIPRTLAAFQQECDEFLTEEEEDDDEVVNSPSGWSYRESQENGDEVDCYECGNPLDDDKPIVNDDDGYAYHEGCLR